jgi:hypothetical protein
MRAFRVRRDRIQGTSAESAYTCYQIVVVVAIVIVVGQALKVSGKSGFRDFGRRIDDDHDHDDYDEETSVRRSSRPEPADIC